MRDIFTIRLSRVEINSVSLLYTEVGHGKMFKIHGMRGVCSL
jgi:hypothetical protein